jgi:hypothetical protein
MFEIGRKLLPGSRKTHQNNMVNGTVSPRSNKIKEKYSEQILYSISLIVNGAILTNNNVEVLTSGTVNINVSGSVVLSSKKTEKTNSDDRVSYLVPKVSNEDESHTVVIFVTVTQGGVLAR